MIKIAKKAMAIMAFFYCRFNNKQHNHLIIHNGISSPLSDSQHDIIQHYADVGYSGSTCYSVLSQPISINIFQQKMWLLKS
jgi:hypothetical protein